MDLSTLSVSLLASAFVVAGICIAVFGSMMTRIADRLADVTGVGEALMGAVFLGGCTSIPGIITSMTAAFEGYPRLAASNAVGGIAAQTVFLAIADIVYRKANLEHAAASIANLMQGTLLVGLLALAIIGVVGPNISIYHIHPVSLLLIAGYIFGFMQISKAKMEPMWLARRTLETQIDKIRTIKIRRWEMMLDWFKFSALGITVGLAGYVVAKSGIAISGKVGISQTLVGGIFTAVTTSLPELVTSIAAVRQGALTLAVGGIIGGNCFDVLFLSFSDIAYRDGSLYAALDQKQQFMIATTILMTAVLLLGLLRREKYGIANIGFESFLTILLYSGMFISISLS